MSHKRVIENWLDIKLDIKIDIKQIIEKVIVLIKQNYIVMYIFNMKFT